MYYSDSMADENQGETPRVPPVLEHPPTEVTPPTVEDGRCDQCGYSLKGLPDRGICPECGSAYTPETAARLKPWPSVMMICLRLGWPLAGLMFFGALSTLQYADFLACYGYPMLVAVPVNSYFQVRWMLKKHLPEKKRTEGFIAGFRALGTVIALLVFLLTLAPLILFGACLIIMAGAEF